MGISAGDQCTTIVGVATPGPYLQNIIAGRNQLFDANNSIPSFRLCPFGSNRTGVLLPKRSQTQTLLLVQQLPATVIVESIARKTERNVLLGFFLWTLNCTRRRNSDRERILQSRRSE